MKKVVEAFPKDISEDLEVEVHRLRRLVPDEINEKSPAEEVLQWAIGMELQDVLVLPNLIVLLRLFLTSAVSVASCERSFSKLKLIKSYLRSTMSQARLDGLSILSIEHEEAKALDFSIIINNFAKKKSRLGAL